MASEIHIGRNDCRSDRAVTSPYENLYIYYLSGCLDAEPHGDDFLGNWEEDGYSFLFFSRPSRQSVDEIIRRQRQLSLLDEYCMTYEEWHGDTPQPFQVGSLSIIPPWLATPGGTSENAILLDPGLVFGTGQHPTTRHCLEALLLARSEHAFDTVLDMGTGTGLLAVAAARLGAQRVLAADLNGLAAKTALKNVRLNGLGERILVVRGDAEKLMDLPNDLMISNIHYDVMQRLIGSKGFLKTKRFILSGLLRSEAGKVASQLKSLNIELVKAWQYDGIWHTYYGRTI